MESQRVTLRLPDSTYRRLVKLASQSQRSLAEETVSLLNAVLTTNEERALKVRSQLEQLTFLTDEELWTVATSTASDTDNEQMQRLLEKRQREGLTVNELEQLEGLSERFNRVMLTRAKSAALLHERGHDLSVLSPSA